VKKLLLLLLIAVVGAGIAVGANAVFFSTASNERPAMQPRGLVDEIASDDVTDSSTPEPSASPKPSPTPVAGGGGSSTGGGSGAAPVPAPSDDGGPRTPRTPSDFEGGPQPTSFVVQGVVDEQDPPEDPCDLEESEREQRECENEADREEDEREQEEDEADDRSDND
jgi:hypothetical protein